MPFPSGLIKRLSDNDTRLRSLDLREVTLDSDDFNVLTRVLFNDNTVLTKLTVSDEIRQLYRHTHIPQLLERNQKLAKIRSGATQVDFKTSQFNVFTNFSIGALIEAVQSNDQIIELKYSHNEIYPCYVKQIDDLIESNRVLGLTLKQRKRECFSAHKKQINETCTLDELLAQFFELKAQEEGSEPLFRVERGIFRSKIIKTGQTDTWKDLVGLIKQRALCILKYSENLNVREEQDDHLTQLFTYKRSRKGSPMRWKKASSLKEYQAMKKKGEVSFAPSPEKTTTVRTHTLQVL